MTNGSTWNRLDSSIRQFFVENGFIECVIALPIKLSSMWNTSVSLVVLSHGNTGVRLIDATKQFVAGRRSNTLSYDHIDRILDETINDSNNSLFVSVEKLRGNEYVLNASRYLNPVIEDGIPFGDVIKRITRGAPLNAEELDSISSQVPTELQYLMLSNIQNGLIDRDLPYINKIDEKLTKYCVTNHCLILSKNGKPYKVAVAELDDKKTILANGNLFLIELIEEKVDPYYIAAFFNSDRGIAALNSITVGATIPNIGIEPLKKLIIPFPSLDEQRQMGEKYKTARDEIALLQLKLEKAKDRMTKAFGEGDS
jgi:type I restriction enzyme M protein